MINHITYLWNNIKNGCCPPKGGNAQPTMRNPRGNSFVPVQSSQNEDLEGFPPVEITQTVVQAQQDQRPLSF
jgi:hypothetical protein